MIVTCSEHRVRSAGPLIAAVLLLAAVSGGCASRATGVMREVPVTVAGATQVDMLVATTRRPAPAAAGTLFSGERGSALSFADIRVSIPPAHKEGEVEWPAAFPGDPARHFVTSGVKLFEPGTVARAFRQRIARTGKRRVLVFVHGYNNGFEDAVYRFAQIAHDTGAPVQHVLFTWPSRGQLLAYPYDRESANYSRDALELLLQALAREPAVSEVAILAHSMGNWVTLEALRQMAIRNGRVPSKITDVMLAAPDVDVDVAATQARAMGKPLPRFTLFTSQDDRALAVSSSIWGGQARLGQIDASREPYRSALERLGVTVLDLTQLKSGDPLNHGKFAQAPQVVQFIGGRLIEGQDIGGRSLGIGDRIGLAVTSATATVGNAAGLVVAAPFAVIDPATRDNLGDRVRTLTPIGEEGSDPGPLERFEQSFGPPARAGQRR